MYYKIISDNTIVSVASENDFRRFQGKHSIILYSDEDNAQYIELNGVLYHDNWLKAPVPGIISIEVDIVRISKEEYDALVEAFETEDTIEIPEEPELEEELPIDEDEDTTLAFVKEQKIKAMSAACRNIIINGFDVKLSDGETHHFSLEIEDQIKIQALALKAQAGETALPWHPDGELCVFFSPADIMKIYANLEELQTYHTTYFNSLKFYIQSMNSVEAVSRVEYGTEIPEQYQSEVLKYLLSRNHEITN